MVTSKEGKSHNKDMWGIWQNCLKSGLNIIWLNLESLDAERRRCALFHFCKQIAADLIHSFGMFFIFHPSVSFYPLQIQGKFFWGGGCWLYTFVNLGNTIIISSAKCALLLLKNGCPLQCLLHFHTVNLDNLFSAMGEHNRGHYICQGFTPSHKLGHMSCHVLSCFPRPHL